MQKNPNQASPSEAEKEEKKNRLEENDRNSRLPRQIITPPARQIPHQARDIPWLARAPQRDQVATELLDRLALGGAFGLAQLLVDQVPHRRADDPGRVGVDGDAVLREFHGVGGGEAADGVLGGGVVGQEGEGAEGDDGGCGDEFASVRSQRLGRLRGDFLYGVS